MKLLALATMLCALAGISPAHAASFQFFEGNNCTQKALGAVDDKTFGPGTAYLLRWRNGGPMKIFSAALSELPSWNDEARSVRITSNWRRVPEPRSSVVTVFDSPDDKNTRDDWARVVVRDATLIPPEGVCVGSFEKPFDRNGVYLQRHPNNGLDGKISTIRYECDEACATNVTVVPADRKKLVSQRHVK